MAGGFSYLALGFAPMGADAKPAAWEASIMSSVVHASVRREAVKVQNPPAVTDVIVSAGSKLYLDDCVGCHGAPAKPPSEFGATFYPPAPQFPLIGTQYSLAEVFWVAKHGIRRTGMYSQSSSYSDAQLWSLAAFIKGMRGTTSGTRDK